MYQNACTHTHTPICESLHKMFIDSICSFFFRFIVAAIRVFYQLLFCCSNILIIPRCFAVRVLCFPYGPTDRPVPRSLHVNKINLSVCRHYLFLSIPLFIRMFVFNVRSICVFCFNFSLFAGIFSCRWYRQ